jgi:hypothetical protein
VNWKSLLASYARAGILVLGRLRCKRARIRISPGSYCWRVTGEQVFGAPELGEFTQLLSASDATYQSRYLGIAGGGNFARLANFRGAQLPPF